MDILLRTIGTHRGAPRLYLDSYALLRAGFTPGLAFRVSGDHERQQLTIAIDAGGDRHVSHKTSRKASRKKACDAPVPVILRAWLHDAGYRVQETELDARLFGSLEHRVRWFLVAHPASLDLTLNDLAPKLANGGQLGDLLDDIASDDPRFRPVEYLLAKEQRD